MNKKCTKCDQIQPISEFYEDKRRPGKHQSRCRRCYAEYGRQRAQQIDGAAWQRQYRQVAPLRVFERKLKREFGISLSQYESLLQQKEGKCWCCGRQEPGGMSGKWHVDHDHSTGVVRGILCHFCNTGIGLLGDTVDGVQNAIHYLSNHANLQPTFKAKRYRKVI